MDFRAEERARGIKPVKVLGRVMALGFMEERGRGAKEERAWALYYGFFVF